VSNRGEKKKLTGRGKLVAWTGQTWYLYNRTEPGLPRKRQVTAKSLTFSLNTGRSRKGGGLGDGPRTEEKVPVSVEGEAGG